LNQQGIGAVILAAGESSRLGQPKQLLRFLGKSLIQRMIEAASDADCSPIAVVLGSDSDRIKEELNDTPASVVENTEWRRGVGSSIRAGVQRLIDDAPDLEAILLLVCDQPFVDATSIKKLRAIRDQTKKQIVASRYAETLGVPAMFDRSCFQELLSLHDGTGAKSVILRDPGRVGEFPFPDGVVDIDTAADYEKLRAK
jgi:molybdenum cofactor cytidylyltransferase